MYRHTYVCVYVCTECTPVVQYVLYSTPIDDEGHDDVVLRSHSEQGIKQVQ
jgi:hypothetical protein